MMKKILLALLFIPFRLQAIDFVTIGDADNKASSNGKGVVAYTYQISKYEITNASYCAFLNSVASTSDDYQLFSPLMQEHFFGGIIRTFEAGRFVYRCKPNYENAPIIGVTWMSAIRYCNWLHYNSDFIHANQSIEKFRKQTEGDEEHGAYNTTTVPLHRNPKALYWLPNENEWLKAAYYNGESWDEHMFAKGSNCYNESGWAYPYPHIKPVGYHVSPSHNGTYDQQGNAAEWIENTREGNEKWKISLGGSLIRPKKFALFNEAEGDFPNKSISTFGIRICRTSDSVALAAEKEDRYIAPIKTKSHTIPFKTDKLHNEYVLVADAGNKGDAVNQFKGRVNYTFYIARTELSNQSYSRFLNAVATLNDPYGLYNINMSTGACGGINRTMIDGHYNYTCKKGYEKLPVVYVNYYDICRYANWMHYGCPETGKSELGTTEGTSSQGAYDTSDFEDVRTGKKPVYETFGKRNNGALFWIPSEDEWYKAAYFDPMKVGNRKYHDYPTRTSDAPTLAQANYMVDNHFSVGAPFYLAPVDSFQNAPSYYGTLQQGGNVWEYTEDWQYGQVGSRGLRGGSWSYTFFGLHACNTDPGGLDDYGYVFGARLCMAADNNGWQPVATPLYVRLYECILLLSMPKMLVIVAAGLLMIICGSVSFIYLLVSRRKQHKAIK